MKNEEEDREETARWMANVDAKLFLYEERIRILMQILDALLAEDGRRIEGHASLSAAVNQLSKDVLREKLAKAEDLDPALAARIFEIIDRQ